MVFLVFLRDLLFDRTMQKIQVCRILPKNINFTTHFLILSVNRKHSGSTFHEVSKLDFKRKLLSHFFSRASIRADKLFCLQNRKAQRRVTKYFLPCIRIKSNEAFKSLVYLFCCLEGTPHCVNSEALSG